MTVDLRYVILVAAFFVPAIAIRIMFWLWGAPITNLQAAAFVSLLLGSMVASVVAVNLFIGGAPILFTFRKPPQ